MDTTTEVKAQKCKDCGTAIVCGRRCQPCQEKENDKARKRRAAAGLQKAHKRAHKNNTRAAQAGLAGTYTAEQMRTKAALFGNKCLYCGGKYEEDDHFIPLERGGGSDIDNMVPSCSRCNNDKGDQDPFEWMMTFTDGRARKVMFRCVGVKGISSSPARPYAANTAVTLGNPHPHADRRVANSYSTPSLVQPIRKATWEQQEEWYSSQQYEDRECEEYFQEHKWMYEDETADETEAA
ncbi:HNH endonuclease [Anaeromyxobacter sp. Fw109-5]|uniref:HNH endonuclease n=1 Tax=Anaeromyxobacter sp. (strain Fw109-5) TaxID=404589 RepID=UPI0000ED75C9|nr:HNH endonuclease signature motif containing protein [Anaeromyxobacter sp. Fw109-5]ABS26851.1 HNH endonuclease [Anaeromyxobacter sp. Fw109-5]